MYNPSPQDVHSSYLTQHLASLVENIRQYLSLRTHRFFLFFSRNYRNGKITESDWARRESGRITPTMHLLGYSW